MSKRALHLAALCVFILALAAVPSPRAAHATLTVYRVTTTGLSSGACGDTWPNACALQHALSLAGTDETLWVKAGVYKPTDDSDSTKSFVIPSGVKVYGGFGGTETDLSYRNPEVNLTILSGDVGTEADTNTDGNFISENWSDIVGNNSRHVVTMDGTATPISTNTVLDGFIITGGQADSGSYPEQSGGGLLCLGGGATHECSPQLSNLLFSGNFAMYGGGILLDGTSDGKSNALVMDMTFRGNGAFYDGGAVYVNAWEGTSSPALVNVTFRDNDADSGGALAVMAYVTGSTAAPTLTNVTFSQNDAGVNHGGAIYNAGASGLSGTLSLTNVIMWGDTATLGGQEIYNTGGVVTISHSIVQGGDGGIGGNNPSNAWETGTGNLNSDPLLYSLGDYGGPTPTMPLQMGSPAIDAGDDTACAAYPVSNLDQRGYSRPEEGNLDSTIHCDMGATESRFVKSTLKSTGSLDGWVLESRETSNRGGSVNAGAGTFYLGDDAANRQYVGILSFNTGALPDSAKILEAVVRIRKAALVGGNPFMTMGKINVDLREPYFSTRSTLQSADFQAGSTHETVGTIRNAPIQSWYSAAISSEFLDHIKLDGTTQIRLHYVNGDNNNLVADYYKFHSGNSSTASYRPQLVVAFYLP